MFKSGEKRSKKSTNIISIPSNSSLDDISEREYHTVQRKSEDWRTATSSSVLSTTDTSQSIPIDYHLDNAELLWQCSRESVLASNNFPERPSTSTMIRKSRGVYDSGRDSDKSLISFRKGSNRLKLSHHRNSDKSYESRERFSDHYNLRKTEEITDFIIYDGIRMIRNNEFDYLPERFPIGEIPEQSISLRKKHPFVNELAVINETVMTDPTVFRFDEEVNREFLSRSFLDKPDKYLKKKKKRRRNSFKANFMFNPNKIVKTIFQLREKVPESTEKQTTETADNQYYENQEPIIEDLRIKAHLHECYFYLIYIVFVTVVALAMASTNMFYFSDLTVSEFFETLNIPYNLTLANASSSSGIFGNITRTFPRKTLRQSRTIEDFWLFAETTMLELLYWEFYYARENIELHTPDNDKTMFFENKILGVPRLRQVRVRDDSCKIHPDLRRFFDSCYGYYSIFTEETRAIKGEMADSLTPTAWVYTEAKTLNTSSYWGELAIYGGGGYYLDLGISKLEAMEMIRELRENWWISSPTRAVFLDFNLYNANINLFCICKLVFEFSPLGGMIPSADFQALKLIRYLYVFDYFILACELVCVIFTIYYTTITVIKIKKKKFKFFFFKWNYIDVIIILLAYTCICLAGARFFYSKVIISTLSDRYNDYTEFEVPKSLQVNFNNVAALLLFVSWIKLLKYLTFSVILIEFRRTLTRSFKGILGFFPMFINMFLAFAFLAYLLFGNQVKEFSSVWFSFLALLQAFLGEFDYKPIQESNRILGPVFYITFIFFIFFVLLNVFIAIINEAYASVKSEVMIRVPKTSDYIKRGILNFLGYCCCGLDRKLVRKSRIKRKIMYEDIKRVLIRAGFTRDEIDVFFAKYKITANNILDENIRNKVIEDLELNRVDYGQTKEQFEISTLRRRVDDLNEKIEEMEISLHPVIDKVDILLDRLKI